MKIEELQLEIDQWIKTNGVRYFNELTNLAILTEEVGELARLMSRKFGEQSFKNPDDAKDIDKKLADELADIIFVAVCLSNQIGINLTDAIVKNLEKKTKRDVSRHKDNQKLKP